MLPVELRRANSGDTTAIVNLFRDISDKELDAQRIESCIDKYPSVLALRGAKLVGFIYSSSFAPDILELLNIAVLEAQRDSGVGSMMLSELERQSSQKYRAIILVNSVLYPSKKTKKLASNFYLKNGYNLVHTTGSTNVFIKDLA
ncbi:GNAT family N-acetyltransferase [Desulfobotulus mexicanus]|nr:GNAT family N-acetyltransferase [Desulfobotulus mexicanus]